MTVVPQAPPSAVRNAEPILEVLQRAFAPPFKGTEVLEIASGSGYHAQTFARAFPHLAWQPTDPTADALASIAAHVEQAKLSNLRQPLMLDVCSNPWPVNRADAVVCINMIHISPWAATEGLMQGCGRILPPGGVLVTYGPYVLDGDFLAESNVAFDESLRSRNPAWGIREVSAVTAAAEAQGLRRPDLVRMPANNLTLIFQKR